MSLLPSSTFAGPDEPLYLSTSGGAIDGDLTVTNNLDVGIDFTARNYRAPVTPGAPMNFSSGIGLTIDSQAPLGGSTLGIDMNVNGPPASLNIRNNSTGSRIQMDSTGTMTIATDESKALVLLQGPGLSGNAALFLNDNVTLGAASNPPSGMSLTYSQKFITRFITSAGTSIPTTDALVLEPGGGAFLPSGFTADGSFNSPTPIGAAYQMITNKGFFVTSAILCTIAWPQNMLVAVPPNGLPNTGSAFAIWRGIGTNSWAPLTVAETQNGVTFGFTPGTTNYFQIILL